MNRWFKGYLILVDGDAAVSDTLIIL